MIYLASSQILRDGFSPKSNISCSAFNLVYYYWNTMQRIREDDSLRLDPDACTVSPTSEGVRGSNTPIYLDGGISVSHLRRFLMG